MVTIVLLTISAFFRSLDQLAIFGHGKSWLPDFVFTWKIVRTLDARHTYMGIKLITFGLGFYFYPWDAWTIPFIIYAYYQFFNLFFHNIWRFPEFWEFPFFRFLFFIKDFLEDDAED